MLLGCGRRVGVEIGWRSRCWRGVGDWWWSRVVGSLSWVLLSSRDG